ncbi:MAG: PBSX family phage terminase large subunit [Ruminococcaceae bacterium]|nr:PBSX family phage terminase large subunit [Oscillospiraceae bacterium]
MNFKPFSKKQLATLCWWGPDSPYRERDAIICDGAVRSGKSLCMFVSFVSWATCNFQNASFALCGRTASSVKRNILTPYLPVLKQLGFKVNYQVSYGKFTLEIGGIKNTFWIFGGKDEASAALIQGMTLSGVMFDEVALMPRSFVEQALARCSVENSKFWFNCNPSNPSHWFYNEWIKKTDTKNALYLHFEMSENPSLSKEMLQRYEKMYSGAFYERFVKGRWVAADGLVYPMFGDSCMADCPEQCEEYYISCDYGTVNPASFGLWGLTDGIWYRLREYYYSSKREGAQKTDEEYYRELRNLAADLPIKAVICDPSAASFITTIRRHGEFRVIPAQNDVLDGIRRVSEVLKSGKLKICRNCRDSIAEFSLYCWDEGSVKDSPRKENDHAMDDIRYFVSSVLFKSRPSSVALAAKRGSR